MTIFSERLTELRKDKNLTQKELASVINVSDDMLSSYERGIAQTPDEVKIKIAKYFNISLDYLMGVIDEQIPYDRKDVVVLPRDFPEESIPKVKEFIRFLQLDSKKKK